MKKNLLQMVALGLVGGTLSVAVADDMPSAIDHTVLPADGPAVYGVGIDPARPFVINISGATLMENFIKAPASTNDFLDVDADGNTVPAQIDNLAGFVPSNPYNAALQWIVQYRVVGSVNGYQELLDFGVGCTGTVDTGITPQAGNPAVQNTPPNGLSSDVCQLAYVNSSLYISNGDPGGASSGLFNANNPGGLPVRSYCTGTVPVGKQIYSAVPLTAFGQPGGSRIDIAPLDVPTSWGTTVPGTTEAIDQPFQPGYGLNPRLNRTRTGQVFVDGSGNPFGFKLVTVNAPFNLYDGNPAGGAAEDAFTVFDTDFAYTPVAAYTNHGTGLQTITFSTQRHMLTTGRTEKGENLMQVTRDTGSGTHNAYVNSFCIDPSHGVGEAIGGLSTASAEQTAGATWIPGNKGGSSGVEATARNSRLAIGYTGAERGVTSGWLTGGRLECLAVLDDIRGGTVPARPTIANVLGFQTIDFNSPFNHTPLANRFNGYNIGGPGVLATLGDPRSVNNLDSFGNPVIGNDAGNMNPAMRNTQAAAYINNITRSTEAFVALGTNPTLFSPGEFLAQTLIINGSRAFTQNRTSPCDLIAGTEAGGVPVIPSLVAQVAVANTLANAAYATFGTVSFNGRTPTRTALTGTNRYSDTRGTAAPNNVFVRQDGTTIGYDNAGSGTPQANGVGARNRIAGDFNGDGLRNWNDDREMIRAWWDRVNRPADTASFNNVPVGPDTRWVAPNGTGAIGGHATSAGTFAIIEILGDFNADGNFGRIWNSGTASFVNDTSDIRYWCDGLATEPGTGVLNRMEGYRRVDQSAQTVFGQGNFFGTVLARGTYDQGDSVGDVAGSTTTVQTPGFVPNGFDGRVDDKDIDYVFAQFRRNPNVSDNALTWSNLAEAQYAVGAGIDGIAGNSDDEVVGNLSCDMNGDLIVDINDVIKIFTILETTRCDVNLDGVVDNADRSIIQANLNTRGGFARGDVDGNGMVNQADLDFCFAPVFTCCPGNADRNVPTPDSNNTVTFSDITAVLANFNTTYGYSSGQGQGAGDSNCDGVVNFSDVTSTLANFGAVCN